MTILIDDDVSPWYGVTADRVAKQLKSAKGDITVEISSDGGHVFEGVRIFNLLRNYSRGEVTTVAMSQAISISSYIFMAGKHRVVYDNSTFMIHNASNGIRGDYRVMEQNGVFLKRVTDIATREYVKASGRSIETIKKEMDDETYFFGQEILDAGFATEIRVSGEAQNLNKADAITNFKSKKVACDMKNSQECLKNFKKEGYSEDLKSLGSLLDEMDKLNQIQHEENEMIEKKEVISFLSSASDGDKKDIAVALGQDTEMLQKDLKDKSDEVNALVKDHEQAMVKRDDTEKALLANSSASMKEVLVMLNDPQFDDISAEDKTKALDEVVLSNDGTVDTMKLENILLKAATNSRAPSSGDGEQLDEIEKASKQAAAQGGEF